MRRLLIVILALSLPLVAGASDSKIIRSYPFNHSGDFNACNVSAGCPTLDIRFDQTVGATLTPDIGPVGVDLDVTGTPVKVDDGTWPNGLSGASGHSWDMPAGAYISKTDAGGGSYFDATGAGFTVCAIVTFNNLLTTNSPITGKYNGATNNRSWLLYSTNGTSLAWLISDDGTSGAHTTSVVRTSAVRPHQMTPVCGTYYYISDGGSRQALYVSQFGVASTAGANGPIFNSTADFTIGADVLGGGTFPGQIHRLTLWQAELSQADVYLYMRGAMGELDGSGGNTVTHYTGLSTEPPVAVQFAPADGGVEPFIGQAGAGLQRVAKVATGEGGLPWVEAISGIQQGGSFETCTAAGATEPDGWTISETAGSGATDLACSATRRAHGSNSLKATITAADGHAEATGACLTVTGATAYRLEGRAVTTSGTGGVVLRLIEYSDACATPVADTDVVTAVPTSAGWTWMDATRTTNAAAVAAQIVVEFPVGADQTTYVDAVQLRTGSYPLGGFCDLNQASTSACYGLIPQITPNPLQVSSATIEGYWWMPYSVSDITGTGWYLLYSKATSGANNLPNIQLDTGGPYVRSTVHNGADGASNSCRNFGDALAAMTTHKIRFSYSAAVPTDGYIWHSVDGTGYNNFSCAGPRTDRAIMNGIGTHLCIGNPNSYAKGAGFVRDLRIFGQVVQP